MPGRAGAVAALVLGGILAALIGAAAALYLFPQGWRTDSAEVQARLTALEARPLPPDTAAIDQAFAQLDQRLAALEAVEPADLAALEDRLDGVAARLETAEAVDLEAIDERLQALAARIDAAETDAPGPDLGPLERELEALTERLAAVEEGRDAEIAAAVDAAFAEARAEQEAREREIQGAAEALAGEQARVEARAALAQLANAAETGAPAPEALSQVAAVAEPPAAMTAFSDGLPTLAALQAEFPAYARRALAAAPARQEASMGDRVMNFLRAQTGARSLAPRAGDDADAVLSRAEAALRGGDVDATLAELGALPPAAAAEVEPWRVRAELRRAALAALAEMQAQLGSG